VLEAKANGWERGLRTASNTVEGWVWYKLSSATPWLVHKARAARMPRAVRAGSMRRLRRHRAQALRRWHPPKAVGSDKTKRY
jgi:hypothetical protein